MLNNACKTMLNMVPTTFQMLFQTNFTEVIQIEQPLELLGGQSILDFSISQPEKVKRELGSDDKDGA